MFCLETLTPLPHYLSLQTIFGSPSTHPAFHFIGMLPIAFRVFFLTTFTYCFQRRVASKFRPKHKPLPFLDVVIATKHRSPPQNDQAPCFPCVSAESGAQCRCLCGSGWLPFTECSAMFRVCGPRSVLDLGIHHRRFQIQDLSFKHLKIC